MVKGASWREIEHRERQRTRRTEKKREERRRDGPPLSSAVLYEVTVAGITGIVITTKPGRRGAEWKRGSEETSSKGSTKGSPVTAVEHGGGAVAGAHEPLPVVPSVASADIVPTIRADQNRHCHCHLVPVPCLVLLCPC
ncbi:hypothetical protein PIB30_076104, partial [Stylosanthes scabra]|nr:hypothetical protein [Stylosanthes scabra]